MSQRPDIHVGLLPLFFFAVWLRSIVTRVTLQGGDIDEEDEISEDQDTSLQGTAHENAYTVVILVIAIIIVFFVAVGFMKGVP